MGMTSHPLLAGKAVGGDPKVESGGRVWASKIQLTFRRNVNSGCDNLDDDEGPSLEAVPP